MIRLTRLNGGTMYLNEDLVATVEAHHDTVVTLVDGKAYVVLDTPEQIAQAVRIFRASVLTVAEQMSSGSEPEGRLLVLHHGTDPSQPALSAVPDGGR